MLKLSLLSTTLYQFHNSPMFSYNNTIANYIQCQTVYELTEYFQLPLLSECTYIFRYKRTHIHTYIIYVSHNKLN